MENMIKLEMTVTLSDAIKIASIVPETINQFLIPGMKIEGDLDLSGTQITSLPEGLSVGWNLDLSGTQITSLPEGLSVGGSLYLTGTQITSLPAGLSVEGGVIYGINPRSGKRYQEEYDSLKGNSKLKKTGRKKYWI